MKVVNTGLKALVDAGNSFNTAIGGRFYFEYATQSPTYPYCIHWYPNDFHDPWFSEEYEEILVQFDIYDQNTSASTIYDIGTYLAALFDDAIPTVVGYAVFAMLREFCIPPVYDHDTKTWQYTYQYRLLIEKN